MNAFQHDFRKIPDLDGAIDKQADDQRVEDGDGSRLCGGADAAVDAAQNDDGGHQRPEALFEHCAQAFCPQFHAFGVELVLILSMDLTVDVRIDHQAQGDQHTRQETGQEQLGNGGAGGVAVHDVGDTGGNDDAQTAGHGHQCGGKGQVIAHTGQQGDAHRTHGRGSSGAGTGDGTVEQACKGHRAGETRGSVAD